MSLERFNKFDDTISKYLLPVGQGDRMATQIVTAVTKLIYKWFNDGDVYDNTRYLVGWENDLSSYANWLYKSGGGFGEEALIKVFEARSDEDYEDVLYGVAEHFLNPSVLDILYSIPAEGNIYNCSGPFKFIYCDEEEDY